MPKKVRTVISIEREDKRWLDQRAADEDVAMTELIRRAVSLLRMQSRKPSFDDLLERTRGIWRGEDGLAYQRRIRDEW